MRCCSRIPHSGHSPKVQVQVLHIDCARTMQRDLLSCSRHFANQSDVRIQPIVIKV